MKITPRLLALVAISPVFASAQIINYTFDAGTGTTAASTGSLAPATLTFSAGAAYGTAGSGVSGASTDFALSLPDATFGDNRASNLTPSALTGLNGLTSYTISTWFNRGAITSSGRLLNIATSSGSSIDIFKDGANNFTFNTGGVNTSSGGSTILNTLGSYVFFAVTVDSTVATNNIKFYAGTSTGAVGLVSQHTFATPADLVTGIASSFTVGNRTANDRGFGGSASFIDELNIFGATSGAGGVLSLSQLDDLRVSTSAIPEPSSFASLAGLAMIGFASLRRRRR
jgi:hypothetical protein